MSTFSDHSDISVLTPITKGNPGAPPQSAIFGLSQQFWATPSRNATDLLVDTLEISYVSPQLTNWIQLDLAKYPHSMTVEYFDDVTQQWTPLLDSGFTALNRFVHQSVPQVIPPPSSIPGLKHPQHSFTGHWLTMTLDCHPTTFQRVRFKLTRVNTDAGPRDVYGNSVAYSLAVRNLSMGYQVGSADDVPRTLPGDENTYYQSFAQGNDVVASTLNFGLRQLDANFIGENGDSDIIWRSEAQPDPNAVVSLYADIRDYEGKPQVVDRIFIDPIINGPHITLYYSKSLPDASFVSPSEPLPATYPDVTQNVTVDSRGMHLPGGMIPTQEVYDFTAGDNYALAQPLLVDPTSLTLFGIDTTTGNPIQYVLDTDYGFEDGMVVRLADGAIPNDGSQATTISYGWEQPDSMLLSNLKIGWNAAQRWLVGMTVIPNFDPTTIDTYKTFFATDLFTLAWTGFGIEFTTATGDLIDAPLDYQQNQQISFVIGYDGVSQYYLTVGNENWSEVNTVDVTTSPDESDIETIAIGSDLARLSFGSTDFVRLVIREDAPEDFGVDFILNPETYCEVKPFARNEDERARLDNLFRFDPTSTLSSSAFPWQMFGGVPSKYDSMRWTPISRDYTCQRGWMDLPPTEAKFWKLEFTHLAAQYADIYQPTTMLVKHFPPARVAEYRDRIGVNSLATLDPGLDQQQDLAAFSPYADVPAAVSTGGTGLGYTNTEVYTATDTVTAERLYRLGEQWAYAENQTMQSAPRFMAMERHIYQEDLVTRTSKMGYIVGLRRLAFSRTSHSASYDTPQYEDAFYDTSNWVSSSWLYDEEMRSLTSGNANTVTATSNTFISNRDVRGLQFATEQSPAVSMLLDSEFEDPEHVDWAPSGDVVLGDLVDSSTFGQLLPVSRQQRSGTWGDVDGLYPTWGDFSPGSVTYGDLSEKIGKTPTGADGVQSISLDQPQGGYLYAAARVIADEDLDAPLWLQLLDTVTGGVLAEEPRNIYRGQICEWHVTYRVGTGLTHLGEVTWGDLAGVTSRESGYVDDFTRDDSDTVGVLRSGQQWVADPTLDTVLPPLAGNRATITEDYPAQVATVDVGATWGRLTIGVGNLVSATYHNASIVPIVKLGGFWLMNDGEIIDANTGVERMRLSSLASNDSLAFDFMPTNLLTTPQNPTSADVSVQSWAMVVTQNGTYRGTVVGTQAFQTVRGITGAAGQDFTSFEWLPRTDLTSPSQPKYVNYPSPFEQAEIDTDASTGDLTVIDLNGNVYLISPAGSATPTTSPYPSLDLVNGFTAAAATEAYVQFDAPSVIGALEGYYDASGSGTDKSTWDMLKLDDTGSRQINVRANGDLYLWLNTTGSSLLATNCFNLTTPANGVVGDYAVIIADTSKLSSAFKTAHSITDGTGNQTLVFMRNGVVQSTYTAADLIQGNTRAVEAYDGASARGLSWSSVPGGQSPVVGAHRTWGQVDGNSILTWGDVLASADVATTNPVCLRLVQKTTTLDTWYCDSLDIYFDPIVWEFSNNNGAAWVAAAEIRNDPDGVMLFDPKSDTITATQLVCRVSAYSANAWVSHMVIRPWYRGFMRDVPVRPAQPHGPNLNPQDHYPGVHLDPHWKVWAQPIPREWFFAFRQLLPDIAPQKSKLPMISERISINV